LKIEDGGVRHLENHKNRDFSATDWPMFMTFGTVMQKWGLNRPLKHLNFKNPRRPMAAILKTVKSPYLHNRLTDLDEFWHGDVELLLTLSDVKITEF